MGQRAGLNTIAGTDFGCASKNKSWDLLPWFSAHKMETWRRIITAPFLYPGFVCVRPTILGEGAAPKNNRGLFAFWAREHYCTADTGCAIWRPLSRLFCWDQRLIPGFRNRKWKDPTVPKVKSSTCLRQADFVECTVMFYFAWSLRWEFNGSSESKSLKEKVWAQQNLTFLLRQRFLVCLFCLRLSHFCPGLAFIRNSLTFGKITYTWWKLRGWFLILGFTFHFGFVFFLSWWSESNKVETKSEFTLFPPMLFQQEKCLFSLVLKLKQLKPWERTLFSHFEMEKFLEGFFSPLK